MIYADDREDGKVLEMIKKSDIDIEIKRLKVGDYVMDDVCIERKSIDDFCMSIVDGRIKKQAKNMKEMFSHNFVLISGRIGSRHSDIDEHCILGMMSSLACGGIQVICVDNDRQLVFLLKRIFERYKDERGNKE